MLFNKLKSEIKIIIILCFNFSILSVHSQIGINTTQPKVLLHIESSTNSTPNNSNNSYINSIAITSDGNVGIGTIEPTNKLTIEASDSYSDLHLPNGASAGSVLRAKDKDGNAYWSDGPLNFYTVIIGQGSQVRIKNTASTPKINQFTLIGYDNVKDIFGESYGWNTTEQQYLVPKNGQYRISYSIYINNATDPATSPILGYIYKNGSQFYDPGFISIAYTGGETKGFISGIAQLEKGDIIDFRIFSKTNNDVVIWAQWGHTYAIIESL